MDGWKIKAAIPVLVVTIMSCSVAESSAKKKEQAADSAKIESRVDSLAKARIGEVEFMISQVEDVYVSGRRGFTDEEWESAKASFRRVSGHFARSSWYYYHIGLRYFGRLTEDAHFKWPVTDGMYNASKWFRKDDVVFPLWVQTDKDCRVYNVKDYEGKIPAKAEIIEVGGYSARKLAMESRLIAHGEPAVAMAYMNINSEPEAELWDSFTNFLFMNNYKLPYKVVYCVQGREKTDTVLLDGIERGEKIKRYRREDRKWQRKEKGMSCRPVVYSNKGDGVGVLEINSFWGKDLAELLVFNRDWRYKRLLRGAMRKVRRDGITDLVIDLRKNPGGMTENVAYTLDYLTEKPVEEILKFSITDGNREKAKMVAGNMSRLEPSSRDSLIRYLDTVRSGSKFRTDSLMRLRCVKTCPKHRYEGRVYVLTSNYTYSAAQLFAAYCRKLGIGQTAGEHCGGYNEVTGNAARVELPASPWILNVPYMAHIVDPDDPPYEYPEVDIPIERPFEEWIERKDGSLDRLIEIILERRNGAKAKQDSVE